MIIIRTKNYSLAVERSLVQLNKEKGIKPTEGLTNWNRENAIKIEKLKRGLVDSTVSTINNPVGAVVDFGKNVITRPLTTAGKAAIAIPFPASVPTGLAAIATGNEINKRIKPLKKFSDKIRNIIENSKGYKTIKKINFNIVKNPYKKNKK